MSRKIEGKSSLETRDIREQASGLSCKMHVSCQLLQRPYPEKKSSVVLISNVLRVSALAIIKCRFTCFVCIRYLIIERLFVHGTKTQLLE